MKVFIYLMFVLTCPVFAQQKQAEKYIADLTSPEFYGRGYTQSGDKKAATYISDLFKSFGLKSFGDDYFQKFSLNVNTFPDAVVLAINGDTLQTGADFIVDPSSGSVTGTFKIITINPENFDRSNIIFDELEGGVEKNEYAFVINHGSITNKDTLLDYYALKYELAKYAPVIWINNDKLTWGVSQEKRKFPIIEISDSIITNSVETIYLDIHARHVQNYSTQNVIGYIPASSKRGRKYYKVITAHYDHLGQMGSTAYIPGANDNASGTSMLLNLAAYYSQNPPKDYNIVFMAFGAEEAGLVGSMYYTHHPLFPLKQINFLVNLDLLGTGEEGITVVNGAIHEEAFSELVKINNENDYVIQIGKRGEAANSDHYFFTKNGVPAFFIYTRGGIKAYHDIYDRSETLPLTEYNDLYQMLIKFLERI